MFGKIFCKNISIDKKGVILHILEQMKQGRKFMPFLNAEITKHLYGKSASNSYNKSIYIFHPDCFKDTFVVVIQIKRVGTSTNKAICRVFIDTMVNIHSNFEDKKYVKIHCRDVKIKEDKPEYFDLLKEKDNHYGRDARKMMRKFCVDDYEYEFKRKDGGNGNGSITPTGSSPYKKATIPLKLRMTVWKKRNLAFDGECYCCKQILLYENFESGHIQAEINGGETILSNLEPICSSCNKSMGRTNMLEFMEKLGTNTSTN